MSINVARLRRSYFAFFWGHEVFEIWPLRALAAWILDFHQKYLICMLMSYTLQMKKEGHGLKLFQIHRKVFQEMS